MATLPEQAGTFMTCPLQGDCQDFIAEHTTVSPEVAAQNVRSASQDLATDFLTGRLAEDVWSGAVWKRTRAAAKEAGEAVMRSAISGKSPEPPKMISHTDEEGELVREFANGCERCHGSTTPVFFKPGERCERSRLLNRAMFNDIPLGQLVERLRVDPTVKDTPSE